MVKTLVGICVLAVAGFAAPAIGDGGVTNAASGIGPGLPNYGIARGALFLVKGTGFGSGATVAVNAGGQAVDATVVTASETQITALLPASAPTGDAKVTVTFNGETSAESAIKIVDRAFGIFTTAGGAAVTLPAVTVAQAATAGQALTLYGTGLGEGDVEVWIGGKQATVTGKGPSDGAGLDGIGFPYAPGTQGLDQIAIQVPDGVQGCRISVVVRTGDFVSNFASLPIMPQAGACVDANGLTADEYGKLLAGGTFKMGSISLSRSTIKMEIEGFSLENTSENGSASFFSYQAADVLANAGSISQTSVGSCTVISFKFQGDKVPVPQITFTSLDAGAAITLTGPKGTKTLAKQKDGSYSAQLSSGGGLPNIPGIPSIPGLPGAGGDTSYLTKGSYTATAPGGSGDNAVGAFTAKLDISDPITWTNRDQISAVQRSSGVTVNWSGGNPQEYVTINGMSIGDAVAGMFYCTEKVSAGSFAVPPVVLLSMPPSSGSVPGTLALSNSASARFTASGIDLGTISSSVSSSKSVSYK